MAVLSIRSIYCLEEYSTLYYIHVKVYVCYSNFFVYNDTSLLMYVHITNRGDVIRDTKVGDNSSRSSTRESLTYSIWIRSPHVYCQFVYVSEFFFSLILFFFTAEREFQSGHLILRNIIPVKFTDASGRFIAGKDTPQDEYV